MISSWQRGLLFLLAGLYFGPPIFAQQNTEPFEIQLIVPISNPQGQREISMDRYPRLHIILTNTSEQEQKLWKSWNTWGYFNLTMSWTAGSQSHRIKRKPPQAWNGDFPDFWIIKPGGSVVLEVDMSSGEWEGFPDLYGESISASLSATYENKADALAREFGIWVGKLSTAPIPVVFK